MSRLLLFPDEDHPYEANILKDYEPANTVATPVRKQASE
jgi:hypothetical protein